MVIILGIIKGMIRDYEGDAHLLLRDACRRVGRAQVRLVRRNGQDNVIVGVSLQLLHPPAHLGVVTSGEGGKK